MSDTAMRKTAYKSYHLSLGRGDRSITDQGDGDLRDLRSLREQATGSYVFETTRGIPLTVAALQGIVSSAGKLAHLHVRSLPHMLRRSTAFSLVNDGADTRLIQAFLGQGDLRRSTPGSAISP